MPVCAISRVTSRVIKKPETTKNTSTPRKPAGSTDGAKWYTMTAATAIARRPSRLPTYAVSRSATFAHRLFDHDAAVTRRRSRVYIATAPNAANRANVGSAPARNRVCPYVTTVLIVTMIEGTSSAHKHRAGAPAPEHDRPDDREDQRRVVRDQAEACHPLLAILARVELHHVERAEQAPRPADPREHHHRKAREMVLHVVEATAAQRARDLRLVAGRWVLAARQRPEAAGRAVVHGRAVRTGEREAVVRGDERGVVEAGEVEPDPGRDHDERDQHRDRGLLPPIAPRAAAS